MNEFKKIIADKWDWRAATFDADHATENLTVWREVLEELIARGGKGRVLDVGTGTGFLANLLAELGYESVGIDFSKDMLEIGRQNSAARGLSVEYHLGDGDALPFADNSFDVLVNCRVIWTLLDPVSSIREWMRVLKPGGVLLSFTRITTPEEQAVWKLQKPENQYPDPVNAALPLRAAPVEKHLEAYRDAGVEYPAAILLRKDLGIDPELYSPWYVFKGVKR